MSEISLWTLVLVYKLLSIPLPIISHISISTFASLCISPTRNITTDARARTHIHTHTKFIFTGVKGKSTIPTAFRINKCSNWTRRLSTGNSNACDTRGARDAIPSFRFRKWQYYIQNTPVPAFGSSRCGLTNRFLISSCVYLLSARDQIDQRETKKANEVTNNAELARSKQLDGTQLTPIPSTQCCTTLLFCVSKILAMHL